MQGVIADIADIVDTGICTLDTPKAEKTFVEPSFCGIGVFSGGAYHESGICFRCSGELLQVRVDCIRTVVFFIWSHFFSKVVS